MKKSELVVGDEYAVGPAPTGRYRAFRCARARIVEIDGAKPGVLVKIVASGMIDYSSVTAGRTRLLPTARDVRMKWDRYATLKAEHDERARTTRAREEREREVGAAASEKLRELGFDLDSYSAGVSWDFHRREFRVSPDEMAALLARIES